MLCLLITDIFSSPSTLLLGVKRTHFTVHWFAVYTGEMINTVRRSDIKFLLSSPYSHYVYSTVQNSRTPLNLKYLCFLLTKGDVDKYNKYI